MLSMLLILNGDNAPGDLHKLKLHPQNVVQPRAVMVKQKFVFVSFW